MMSGGRVITTAPSSGGMNFACAFGGVRGGSMRERDKPSARAGVIRRMQVSKMRTVRFMANTLTSMCMPRAAPREIEAPAPAPAPKAAAAGVSRRVLIVDDNLDAAETLAMMLELLGQQTRQAHEGVGALQAAVEYQPELVFMDIGLPGMSGHEIASRMRRELGMTDAYIVALSGYGSEEDRRRSLHAGFDSHLVKPLDPSTLPSILAACERRRGTPANAMITP